MIKNYTVEKISNDPMTPSDKTIQFILNYSKSLHFVQSSNGNDQIELNLN